MAFVGVTNAQNPFGYYNDALLFSYTDNLLGSSARIQGIGGAQTSLGGDISSAVSNPAGLGFFNRSTFAITPSLDFISNRSTFQLIDGQVPVNYPGEVHESFKTNFNFANVGTVVHFPAARFGSGNWKGSSMGITINRRSSFHSIRDYSGVNDFSSIADSWAIEAGDEDPGFLPENPFAAYDQYLISPYLDEENNLYYEADFEGYPIQNETIKERGSHYQINASWGGNYADFIYFGGGLGIQILNYHRQRSYIENDFVVFDENGEVTGPDENLNSIALDDELNIRGSGINFNAGVIVRPLNFWTIGASYTSPSFLAMDDESFFDLNAQWRQGAISGSDSVDLSSISPYASDIFISSYSLRTPARYSLGTTLFLGNFGFITGDVERVDYSNALLRSDDFSENSDNQVIESLYTHVLNLKLGAEIRFGGVHFRSGYAIYPSPYLGSTLEDQRAISLGLGYRNEDFYIDLAIVERTRSVRYQPYSAYDAFPQPEVISDLKNTTASLTVGFNF